MREGTGTDYLRSEDGRLLHGTGRFVADLPRPGALSVAIVRSTEAAAMIENIEVAAALRIPGVVAVVTGADLQGAVLPFERPMGQRTISHSLQAAAEPVVKPCPMPVLAVDRVRYVGEGIAAVVAESRHIAEDGADAVVVDYVTTEAVIDVRAALEPGSPLVHPEIGTNEQAGFEVTIGSPQEVIAATDDVVELSLSIPRMQGNPLECRAVAVEYDAGRDRMTIFANVMHPHQVREHVAEMLDIPAGTIRVVAPDVGGSFGVKGNIYPEEILLPHLARSLRRDVNWIEDRREHLIASAHTRDQQHLVRAAYDEHGRVLAVDDDFLLDAGAYNRYSVTVAYNTAAHLRGPYQVKHYRSRGRCVLTDKSPNTPYRGTGRPEATFVMERVLETVARRTGLDPAEVRRRNLIESDQMPYPYDMPYRDGSAVVADSGDFRTMFEDVLRLANYKQLREDQRQRRSDSKLPLGIGIANYIEGTGIGPFEGATARLDPSGRFVLHSGAAAQGQGAETVLAAIAGRAMGVSPDQFVVNIGDTETLAYGVGNGASRGTVTAGSAAHLAASSLRQQIVDAAAKLLGRSPSDLRIENGRVVDSTNGSTSIDLTDLYSATKPGPQSPLTHGLEATEYFVPKTITYSSGFHVAAVEVDPKLGQIRVLRYAIVHDCGEPVDEKLVEGQILGGLAQGLGEATLEHMTYDAIGQPTASTLLDYLLPTVADMPLDIRQQHAVYPSPHNPIGVKGVGEAAAICPPVALANAVEDALGLHDRVNSVPLTPRMVWELTQEGQ